MPRSSRRALSILSVSQKLVSNVGGGANCQGDDGYSVDFNNRVTEDRTKGSNGNSQKRNDEQAQCPPYGQEGRGDNYHERCVKDYES